MKKVQIDYELFRKLIFYHLGSDDQYEEEIRNGLEEKLDALVRHELYTKYKTAPSEEEQEKARQEYLDKRGVIDGDVCLGNIQQERDTHLYHTKQGELL